MNCKFGNERRPGADGYQVVSGETAEKCGSKTNGDICILKPPVNLNRKRDEK